jgi:NADH:ubiquinone oxidoreductase subunit K
MEEGIMEEETSKTRPAEVKATTVPAGEAQPSGEQMSKRTQVMIIGGAILFLVVLIAAIVLMATYEEATQVIRDIAIVFVAVETFLIGLAMLLLIFQIQTLIQVLRDEVQPLLRSVNDTASTVRGTTAFVSQNVVSPFIKLAGFTAAVQRVTSDLFHIAGAARPRSKSSQSSIGGNEDVQPRE